MTEQQPYDVERTLGNVEVRRYPRHVVAQTVVEASFDDAGNAAFRRLVGYIGGQNHGQRSIEMTAPVSQQAHPPEQATQIEMTAPVTQQVVQSAGDDRYLIAFVLPAGLTIDTAPEPTNPDVELREVPERLAAAIRFSGRWSERSFTKHRDELWATIADAGLDAVGDLRFARFDPPYQPWFLRRNEVVQDVAERD